MWSNKKYIDIIINLLIFLLGINFLHYGQFILPIICLILFIDNGFRLKIRNFKVFILLCVFAISVFIFSYKVGIYSVMGFCLPMAFYIGNNLRNATEQNVRKIIYFISFGMATHMVLNMFNEICALDWDLAYLFNKPTHYDFWTQEMFKTTGTATNYFLLLSFIYYIVIYEKKITYKVLGIILFILASIYSVALARRTLFVITGLSLCFSIFSDFVYVRKKIKIKTAIICFAVILLFGVAFIFVVVKTRFLADYLMIFDKFAKQGFTTERLDILSQAIKLYPKYLFGGQNISGVIGQQIHDLWGDVYDFGGIIPFVLLVVLTVLYIKNVVLICKKESLEKQFKLSCISLSFCIFLVFSMEPIFSGASIFLICFVMIAGLYASLNNEKYKKWFIFN